MMAQRAKYESLADYLSATIEGPGHRATVTLSFDEVEQILGSPLPRSARRSPSFWGNDPTHTQARAWVSRGWMTRLVSIPSKHVTFVSNTLAAAKQQELAQLELLAIVDGSRRAAREHARTLPKPLATNAYRRDLDRNLFATIAAALLDDDRVSVTIHPAPARGSRTTARPGILAARCGRAGASSTRLHVIDRRVLVDVRLGGDLGIRSRWPEERVATAVFFSALWEASNPCLAPIREQDGETTGPLRHLLGMVRFQRPPTVVGCRRMLDWLCYEVDAYEDGLRKILTRKTPVSAERAHVLALRRLARHRRPRWDVMVMGSERSVDLLTALGGFSVPARSNAD
jgi:hypothetical protein